MFSFHQPWLLPAPSLQANLPHHQSQSHQTPIKSQAPFQFLLSSLLVFCFLFAEPCFFPLPFPSRSFLSYSLTSCLNLSHPPGQLSPSSDFLNLPVPSAHSRGGTGRWGSLYQARIQSASSLWELWLQIGLTNKADEFSCTLPLDVH